MHTVVGGGRRSATGSRWQRVIALAGLLGAEVLLAAVVVESPSTGLVVAAAFVGVALLGFRGAALALALPSSFLAWRVAGGNLSLSVADALLVVFVVVALPFVDRSNIQVRRVLLLGVAYLAMLAVNVFADFSVQAAFEWLHRWILVVGAVAVGAAVASTGRTRLALRMLVGVASVFAVAAVVFALASGFAPAYALGLHKNFVGPLLAMVSLALLAARESFSLSEPLRQGLFVLLGLGLLATQSRASILGLLAGVLVVFLRGRRSRTQVLLLAPLLVGLGVFVYLSLKATISGANDNQFNAVRTRQSAYAVAWQQFRADPVFGAGIRWFRTPSKLSAEPHSVVYATVSEAGLWGVLALVLLFGGVWLVLRGRHTPLTTAALACLAFRLVEGQFAIFWLAGTMTLPWLLVGIAVGERTEGAREETVSEAAAGYSLAMDRLLIRSRG